MATLAQYERDDDRLTETAVALSEALTFCPISLHDDEAKALLDNAFRDLLAAQVKIAAALARMNIVISSELVS
jgi:hypothetical protein